MPLTITVANEGDRVVLALEGDLDMATSSVVQRAALQHYGASHLVLDLSKVAFLDSSGLHALLLIHNVADQPSSGPQFVFRSPSQAVQRTLDLTMVGSLLRIERAVSGRSGSWRAWAPPLL